MAHGRALREFVRAHAEDRPGVYRIYGPGEELLYVGKSVRVRSRLLSYFRAAPGEKAAEIVADAVHAAWDHVPNEFAAVVTEMKLIQRHRPPFNVEHKRRRPYVFIRVTPERAPRVLAVSRVVADGSVYFGPFPRARRVATAVLDLAHTLGLRDCAASVPVFFGDQLDIFAPGEAATVRTPWCMRADLGSCLGPCCGRTDAATYAARVLVARRFLGGAGKEPLRVLEKRMGEAAARLDFEYAALLRDRRERLGSFREELTAFRGEVEGLTFLYRVPGFKGDDRIYLMRSGRIRAELPHPKGREARGEVARAVEEVYSRLEAGPDGLTPEEAAEVLLVARWFRSRPRERRRTFGPKEWLAKRGAGEGRGFSAGDASAASLAPDAPEKQVASSEV
ncbi:MAG TPA: UvrB/UvrC motif-containing protein [Candidatus Thermoplasmatota archaeon]